MDRVSTGRDAVLDPFCPLRKKEKPNKRIKHTKRNWHGMISETFSFGRGKPGQRPLLFLSSTIQTVLVVSCSITASCDDKRQQRPFRYLDANAEGKWYDALQWHRAYTVRKSTHAFAQIAPPPSGFRTRFFARYLLRVGVPFAR